MMLSLKRWLWCIRRHNWRRNRYYGSWYRETCCACEGWERLATCSYGPHGRRCTCEVK